MQDANASDTVNHRAAHTDMKLPPLASPFVPVQAAVASAPVKEHWVEALPRRSSLNLQQISGYHPLMSSSSTSSNGNSSYPTSRIISRPIIYQNTMPSPSLSIRSLESPQGRDRSVRTPPRAMSISPLQMQHDFYGKLTDAMSPSAKARRLVTAPFIPQPFQVAQSSVPLRRVTLTQSDLPSYRKIQPERSNPRARKRSANISELQFSHFYHPTEKPFNKIRVWKNDRNLLFYDCDCGRRKAVQDLKKILNHVSKNCRLCENGEKSGSGNDSPFESPFDPKEEVGMKPSAADIAAAAAILTMSNAKNELQSTLSRDVDRQVVKSRNNHDIDP